MAPYRLDLSRNFLESRDGEKRTHFSGPAYVIVAVTRRQLAQVSGAFLNSWPSRIRASVIVRISVKLVEQMNARQAGHRGSPGACLRMIRTASVGFIKESECTRAAGAR